MSESAPPAPAASALDVPRAGGEYSVLAFLADIKPFRSVVGLGDDRLKWLNAAQQLGASEIRGLDDPAAAESAQATAADPPSPVNSADASTGEKKFDLALCVNGPPHGTSTAEDLVRNLCSAASWVVFAASPPSPNDVSPAGGLWIEQWAKLFDDHGYKCFDILRRRFWHDPDIAVEFRQGACLYVPLGAHYAIKARGFQPSSSPRSLIHPETLVKLAVSYAGTRQTSARLEAFYVLAGRPAASSLVKEGGEPAASGAPSSSGSGTG